MDKPTWFNIITITIAIYSAIVATTVAYISWIRDKRNVILYIRFIPFYEKYKLIIVNTGHRLITIVGIRMAVYKNVKGKVIAVDSVPANSMFISSIQEMHLPFTIKDGEEIDYTISSVVSEMISKGEEIIKVEVEDAEGHTYKSGKIREINPKFTKTDDV